MAKENNDQNDLSIIWDKMWNWDVYNNEDLRKFKNLDKLKILKQMGLGLSPGQRVLDGGCGDGLALLTFIKEFSCLGFGIDISPESLKKAELNFFKEKIACDLKIGDVRNLPYNNSFFDVCLSFGVVEHFSDYHKALTEIYRVLKPGGMAVFIQPHKYSFAPLYRIFRQWQGKWNCGYQFEFGGKELGNELLELGFSDYQFLARGPYRDMPYVFPFDTFARLFTRKWGHYLFLTARK